MLWSYYIAFIICVIIQCIYINYISYIYLLLFRYFYVIVCSATCLYHSSYSHLTYLLIFFYISISIYYIIFEIYCLLTKCLYTLCELVLYDIYSYLYINYTSIWLLNTFRFIIIIFLINSLSILRRVILILLSVFTYSTSLFCMYISYIFMSNICIFKYSDMYHLYLYV